MSDKPNFILNPLTNRFVKRNGPTGRKILKGLISKPENYIVHRLGRDEKERSNNDSATDENSEETHYHINLVGRNSNIRDHTSDSEDSSYRSNKKKIKQYEIELKKRELLVARKEKELIQRERRIAELEKKYIDDDESTPTSNSNVSVSNSNVSIKVIKEPSNNKPKTSTMKSINIYTDGAVSNNGSSRENEISGGIGIYFGKHDRRNVSERFLEKPITNQRAELYAIIKALQICIKDKMHINTDLRIIIHSDSMYAINIFTGVWKASENLDLVKMGRRLIKHVPNLELKHVRAHGRGKKRGSHYIGNYMADKLAARGKTMS